MINRIAIAPSLLAADFSNLESELRRVEAAGCDMIHLDIMDGHFVPNLTFGPAVVESLRKKSTLFFDAHLMINNPEKFIEPFAKAGVNGITVHLEVCPEPENILDTIGSLGLTRGLAINPDVPISRLKKHLEKCDRLLIMSVFAGFGGQKFIQESLERIQKARIVLEEEAPVHADLQVDGGVNTENAAEILQHGATNLVAGTALFRALDMSAEAARLRGRK